MLEQRITASVERTFAGSTATPIISNTAGHRSGVSPATRVCPQQ